MEIQRVIFCENLDISYFISDKYWATQIWEVDDIFLSEIFKEIQQANEKNNELKIEFFIYSNNPAFFEIIKKTFSLSPQILQNLFLQTRDTLIILKNGKWYVVFVWNLIQEEIQSWTN
jgi:hypothetical protein